jgi:hypothetical protein
MPRKDPIQRASYALEYSRRPQEKARRKVRRKWPKNARWLKVYMAGYYRRNKKRIQTAAAIRFPAQRAAQRKRLGTTPKPKLCQCCRRKKPLQWDHDHVTGAFRGWICTSCNAGIGQLGDTLAGVKMAIIYLKKRRLP